LKNNLVSGTRTPKQDKEITILSKFYFFFCNKRHKNWNFIWQACIFVAKFLQLFKALELTNHSVACLSTEYLLELKANYPTYLFL